MLSYLIGFPIQPRLESLDSFMKSVHFENQAVVRDSQPFTRSYVSLFSGKPVARFLYDAYAQERDLRLFLENRITIISFADIIFYSHSLGSFSKETSLQLVQRICENYSAYFLPSLSYFPAQ